MLTYLDIASIERASFDMQKSSKHIAALFDGNTIVSVGVNSYAKHAEEAVLDKYHATGKRIRSLKMYIIRLGENKLSRPCKDCCALLRRNPNIRVFYSDEAGRWVEELHFDSTHHARRRFEFYENKRQYCKGCSSN
jgi:RNase P subunit RPR2